MKHQSELRFGHPKLNFQRYILDVKWKHKTLNVIGIKVMALWIWICPHWPIPLRASLFDVGRQNQEMRKRHRYAMRCGLVRLLAVYCWANATFYCIPWSQYQYVWCAVKWPHQVSMYACFGNVQPAANSKVHLLILFISMLLQYFRTHASHPTSTRLIRSSNSEKERNGGEAWRIHMRSMSAARRANDYRNPHCNSRYERSIQTNHNYEFEIHWKIIL